jgi:2,4-dienoyl-CoA reductase (NADPH2)
VSNYFSIKRFQRRKIIEQKFDEVILATGVIPRIPSIPGVDNSHVISYVDLILNKRPAGKKVVVIGAGGNRFLM